MSPPLERLWAAWRADYVSGAEPGPEDGSCVLCRVVEEGSHLVWRGAHCAVVLNAYPYTNGHVMVLPVRHMSELEDLDGAESAELWSATLDAVRAIREAYRPDGLNMGANLGRPAGAGLPGHLHVHVLPRWDGDTNFMTAVAGTRVLPESLPASAERLRAAWPA
ncbi:MAG: HIT family protein [Acidimicrobiales bacterium]